MRVVHPVGILSAFLLTVCLLLCANARNHVLSLGGDGDCVEIANSEMLNHIDGQVTMEAWVRATEFQEQCNFILYKQPSHLVACPY